MAQLVEHHLAKVGVAGSSPVVRSRNLTAEAIAPAVFVFEHESGLEPMRWNSVKKTAQWAVFRNSPEGFSLRGRGARSASMSPLCPLQSWLIGQKVCPKMDVDPGQRPFFIVKLKRNDFPARTKSVS